MFSRITAVLLSFGVALLVSTSTALAAAAPEGRSFAGVNLGVGFSYTLDLGAHDRVKAAEVVDGVVRVTDVQNGVLRVLLEGHYFFNVQSTTVNGVTTKRWFGDDPNALIGHGPFVAIQSGEEEVIDAIGLGWMIGFRRSKDETRSWNLGVGVIIDPNQQVLGDGIIENEPLPGDETLVRFKKKQQVGLLIMTSFSW